MGLHRVSAKIGVPKSDWTELVGGSFLYHYCTGFYVCLVFPLSVFPMGRNALEILDTEVLNPVEVCVITLLYCDK